MTKIKVSHLSNNAVWGSVEKNKFDAEMKEVRTEILRVEERKKTFYNTRESIVMASKKISTSKRLYAIKKQNKQQIVKGEAGGKVALKI